MKFKIIEGITQADVAYEIFGKNLSELFTNAGLAIGDAMADLKQFKAEKTITFEKKDSDIESLLHDFLSEIVYYKDAEELIFPKIKAIVEKKGKGHALSAELKGEKIDSSRHEMKVDVKAVTYHHFKVEQKNGQWVALVVFDI